MNEQIKELYTKAYCMAFDEADDKNFLDHHMEKFAELIVKECASKCVYSVDQQEILAHFGVEE